MPRHFSSGARWFGASVLGVGLLLSACSSPGNGTDVASAEATPDEEDSSALATMLDPCAKPNLTTVEPGALTFVTSAVPAPPYFLSDQPSDRLGFEADLAYSLAEELGFRPGEVTWEFVPAEQVLSGEFTAFDLAVGGYSARDIDSSAVVFSQPYLVNDAVVIAQNDDIRNALLGRVPEESESQGARSLRWGSSAHRSDAPAPVAAEWELSRVDSFVGAQELLAGGSAWSTAEVVVTDDAHAVWMEAIGGESPVVVAGVEPAALQYALALVKGNPMQPCIDRALGEMSEAGTLDQLKDRWLDPVAWSED